MYTHATHCAPHEAVLTSNSLQPNYQSRTGTWSGYGPRDGWMASSFIVAVTPYYHLHRVHPTHCGKWFSELRVWLSSAEVGGATPTERARQSLFQLMTSWPLQKGGANRLQKGGEQFLPTPWHMRRRRWTRSRLRFCHQQCRSLRPRQPSPNAQNAHALQTAQKKTDERHWI